MGIIIYLSVSPFWLKAYALNFDRAPFANFDFGVNSCEADLKRVIVAEFETAKRTRKG